VQPILKQEAIHVGPGTGACHGEHRHGGSGRNTPDGGPQAHRSPRSRQA
jgi:hypothetical protein